MNVCTEVLIIAYAILITQLMTFIVLEEMKNLSDINKQFSTDDLTFMLYHIRLSLRGSEYLGITEVIDRLENPGDVTIAKKILSMINDNHATLENIKNFCELYLKAKEEE